MSKRGRQSQSLIRSGAPIAGADHRVLTRAPISISRPTSARRGERAFSYFRLGARFVNSNVLKAMDSGGSLIFLFEIDLAIMA